MSGFLNRLIAALMVFQAAAQASAAVRQHRQPTARTLQTLGIDIAAMRAIHL